MNDKKIIILKCDACGENLGEIEYIKFLDDNNKAYIYDPLLAPRYLKCYLEENNYVIGYAITDEKIIKKYEDKMLWQIGENFGNYLKNSKKFVKI